MYIISQGNGMYVVNCRLIVYCRSNAVVHFECNVGSILNGSFKAGFRIIIRIIPNIPDRLNEMCSGNRDDHMEMLQKTRDDPDDRIASTSIRAIGTIENFCMRIGMIRTILRKPGLR